MSKELHIARHMIRQGVLPRTERMAVKLLILRRRYGALHFTAPGCVGGKWYLSASDKIIGTGDTPYLAVKAAWYAHTERNRRS